MEITEGKYKDVAALIIENEKLRVTILPEWGAKVASIYCKERAYETLYQRPGDNYRKSAYGSSYLEGELSGFDDMVPNIAEGFHPNHPWRAAYAPDHGELWTLPCSYEIAGNEIIFTCSGVRFPYTFSKRISLHDNRLKCLYTAKNNTPFDMDFIWTAHPMFKAHEGMELLLPNNLFSVVNTVANSRLGRYGLQYNYPTALLNDGSVFDLNRVPALTGTSTQKYWFLQHNTEGWCGFRNAEKALTVMLHVSSEVPYLGIFVDEGAITGELILALEPATAAMDSLAAAQQWGMNSVLAPYGEKNWDMDIVIAAT